MTDFDLKRRMALKGLGAFGLVSVLGACGDSGSASSDSRPLLGEGTGQTRSVVKELVIDASVSATGIPDSYPVYAYITGLVQWIDDKGNAHSDYYWYSLKDNKPIKMAFGDSVDQRALGLDTGLSGDLYIQNYSGDWANYSIALSRGQAQTVADLSSFNSENIQGFGSGLSAFSGRIWFSVGKPLIPFIPRVDETGKLTGYTTPIVSAGGFGSYCFYDWLEFSYDINGLLYINTTQVDQYGFPISVSATGANVHGGTQGLYNKKRSEILSVLASQEQPLFNTFVAIPDGNNVAQGAYPPFKNAQGKLRALAPSKTTAVNGSDYLDSVIADALNHWKTNWLSVTCSGNSRNDGGVATYYGRMELAHDGCKPDEVEGCWQLCFYSKKETGDPQFCFRADEITTQNMLDCDGQLTGINEPFVKNGLLANLQNTGKAILAGFNRGVINATTTVLNIDSGAPYAPPLSENYPSSGIRFNTWPKLFHEFSANHLAYGFAYDDVGESNRVSRRLVG